MDSYVSFKQKRGVDDTEKLPFYPYRDDGTLLYEKLDEFADAYVDAYVDILLLASYYRAGSLGTNIIIMNVFGAQQEINFYILS